MDLELTAGQSKAKFGLISSSITGILGQRNVFPSKKIKKVWAVDKGLDLNHI